jgi:hypothetical protein
MNLVKDITGSDQEQGIDQELRDLALETRILQFLSSRHVPGLRNLGVRAKNGIVTVTGIHARDALLIEEAAPAGS